MKKLLLIGIVLSFVFGVNAASYRQLAALDKGLNPTSADTATITYNDRIYALHRVACGKMSGDSVSGWKKTDFANINLISAGAWDEFTRRGMEGTMRSVMESLMLSSSNVFTNMANCTDGQLEASYKNKMWIAMRQIDIGK